MVRQSQPASPISSMRKGLLRVSQALSSVWRSFAALRKRSSRIGRSTLAFGFELDDGLAHQVRHLVPDLVVGLVDALGIEVAPDLAENVVLARKLHVGHDHLARIGLRLVALDSHQPGRPKTQQLVPPRVGLELELLVMSELPLIALLAILKACHLLA